MTSHSHLPAIGMGYNSNTVVGVSTCLNKECMRLVHSAYLQKKGDLIEPNTMIDIMTVSE